MWRPSCCRSLSVFFFQAEDGIRDLVRSRGLGDVYKRQEQENYFKIESEEVDVLSSHGRITSQAVYAHRSSPCLLYTSDAADDLLCVDLGGRRIITKKKSS